MNDKTDIILDQVADLDVRVVRLETQSTERRESDAQRWADYMRTQRELTEASNKRDEEFREYIKAEVKGIRQIIINATGALLSVLVSASAYVIFKGHI